MLHECGSGLLLLGTCLRDQVCSARVGTAASINQIRVFLENSGAPPASEPAARRIHFLTDIFIRRVLTWAHRAYLNIKRIYILAISYFKKTLSAFMARAFKNLSMTNLYSTSSPYSSLLHSSNVGRKIFFLPGNWLLNIKFDALSSGINRNGR